MNDAIKLPKRVLPDAVKLHLEIALNQTDYDGYLWFLYLVHFSSI